MKKRIGNDFTFYWRMTESGTLIDINMVSDFNLVIRHRSMNIAVTPYFTIVDGSPLIECSKDQLTQLGKYFIVATWKIAAIDYSDGYRDSAADVDTFEIVSLSAQEDDEGNTVTSEVGLGFRGLSAFEVWQIDNPEGTKDDFEAWIRQPATEAAELATEAAANATNAATAAGTATQLTLEATELANQAVIDANNARDSAIESALAVVYTNEQISSAELLRVNAEGGRSTAEQTRVTSENDRQNKETLRQNAEVTRGENETSRLNAETTRGGNETIRQNQEGTRQTQEAARVVAENARVAGGAMLKTQVKEVIGTSTTDVMSQRATTDALLNTAISVPINESSGEGGLTPESYPTSAPTATDIGISLVQQTTPLGLVYAHRMFCTSANTNGSVWKQFAGLKLTESYNKGSYGFWFNYTQLAAIMVAAGNVAPFIEFSGASSITFPYGAFTEVTGHMVAANFSDYSYKAKILDSVTISGNEWRYFSIVIWNVQIVNNYSASNYYRTWQIKFATQIRAAMIANSALVWDIAGVSFIKDIDTYLNSLLYYKDISYTISGLSYLNSRIALEESKSATLISDLDIAEAAIIENTAAIVKNTTVISDILSGNSYVNIFNRVGTATPDSPFANLAEVISNGGNPKVENLTEIAESLNSPFKTKLGRITKFTNTVTVNQTCGVVTGSIFTQTPSVMGFSFWTRDADWATFTPNMVFGFQLLCSTDGAFKYCPVDFNMTSILAGTVSNQVAAGGLLTGSLKIYKHVTISGWSQICMEMTNLSWILTAGKTWALKLNLNTQNSKWVNKSFYIANPQMNFGAVCPLGVNVIQDTLNTMNIWPSNLPYVQSEVNALVVKDASLQTQIDNLQVNANNSKSLTVIYTDQRPSFANVNVKIKSILSANYFVTNSMTWSGGIYNPDGNPAINFGGTSVTKRDTLVETTINYEGDSISATNLQDGYFGANHGNSQYRYVTVAGHGKTFADIASKWSSGGKNYYIVAIVDANTLGILSENQGTFDIWQFSPFPSTGTLVHVSGAVNTSNIVVAASVMHQLYPSEVIIKQGVFLDGVEITVSGTYYGDILEVVDVWDALNPAGALNALIANKPVGGYTSNPLMNSFANVKHVLRYSNTYRFTKGGLCMTIMDWIPLAPIAFNQFFPMHTKLMVPFAGGGIYYYLPKGLPCPDGLGAMYDYRTVQPFVACSGSINYTSDYWENPLLPPDRAIEFVGDAVTPKIIGLHHGYLFDKGIGGATRKDYLTNAWWIYESRASYNAAMDGKIGPQDIGAHYSFAAFRKYEDVTIHPTGILSVSQFDVDGTHYMYADFNAAGNYEVNVDTKSLGRVLEVFEKSTNVTILGGLSSAKLLIKVDSNTPMYGYAVMKLK